MSKPLIVPIFIPHLGCPHTCVFCNQKKIAGAYACPSAKELREMVQAYRASGVRSDREVQLAFYGGSFTGLDFSMQHSLLEMARELKAEGMIQKVRLSTRPDYIDDGRLKLLASMGADIIELGVQSMDEAVLSASQRGHTAQDVRRAVALIRSYPVFQMGLQMMVALPEDTPEKSIATAQEIASLTPDFVRIYPTAIIKDTLLAERWQQGQYRPWSMDEILDTTAKVWDIFYRGHIPVIRIGLQAADNLQLGQDLLGGAYHPALGEMVKSRWYRQQMERIAKACESAKGIVYCHPSALSQFIGQHRSNIDYFKEKYHIALQVLGDEAMAKEAFRWEWA